MLRAESLSGIRSEPKCLSTLVFINKQCLKFVSCKYLFVALFFYAKAECVRITAQINLHSQNQKVEIEFLQ